jgi:hypothetical protein
MKCLLLAAFLFLQQPPKASINASQGAVDLSNSDVEITSEVQVIPAGK